MADKFAWFDEARFGMFIHWGAYSCGARYTWLKSHERLTTEEYNKYTDHFDPDLVEQWNGELPTYVGGEGTLPILDLTGKNDTEAPLTNE